MLSQLSTFAGLPNKLQYRGYLLAEKLNVSVAIGIRVQVCHLVAVLTAVACR